MEGQDTLALLPTGGGKSLCYQVPGLAQEGICIVVSPLIALMKDQVAALQAKGVLARAIISGMDHREIDITLDNCIHGKTKFLYVSPERLSTELFRERFRQMKVSLIAVDEAHCISQWGYDFRPAYLRIAEVREIQPEVPVLAVTATATPEVAKDIRDKLAFRHDQVFRKSFERENLSYVVLHEEDKYGRLLRIAKNVKGTGIVYVRSRKKTGQVARFLKQNGIGADSYHAGISRPEREKKQNEWTAGGTRVMVATNAFGMGIDKPDVRFVAHMDLPDSLEAYFQEAGRGGRDGKRSYAVLLYNDGDRRDMEKRFENAFPPMDTVKRVYQALGNYLKVAIGAGEGISYPFRIDELCKQYELNPMTSYNALKLLEINEYITLSSGFYAPSRVMIRMDHRDLYSFEVSNRTYEALLKTLLRSYGGLFDDLVAIDERTLAKRADLKEQKVREQLKALDRMEVIMYIPARDDPVVTFNTERLPPENLYLSDESYRIRKKAWKKRMDAVLHYASSTHKCRSRILLSYFGEKNTRPCGHCDVCIEERKKPERQHPDPGTIENALKDGPLSLNTLAERSGQARPDDILPVVRELVDAGKVVYDGVEVRWVGREG